MILILASAIIIGYIILILLFWFGWEKAQPCQNKNKRSEGVTIIIAVRNEAKNITNLLKDISEQTYPLDLIELVIVDDHSTDRTPEIIKEFTLESPYVIELIELTDSVGKKSALKEAMGRATNEIILSTDGDCRTGTNWISSMTSCFENEEIKLVSGPVKMYPQNTIFQRLQSIEFSSLISSGAATLTLGWPTMANAANLAFRKSAFEEVNGHEEINVSSGDDVFLLHKISSSYRDAVRFCRDAQAIVNTEPSNNLQEFYNQRKRWSGKWQFYKDPPTISLAIFVFLVNLVLISLPLLILSGIMTWVIAVNLFVLKLAFEFWFLRETQKFFQSKFLLHEFLILAIIYPYYVTFMAVAGLLGGYQWKDRVTQ